MIEDRVKLQVWGSNGWRTAYVLPRLLMLNIALLRGYRIDFRVVNEKA